MNDSFVIIPIAVQIRELENHEEEEEKKIRATKKAGKFSQTY
jgi:hypothetical protein